jgi:hypothetical protein
LTTVTCTATDTSNNSSSCSFTVTVTSPLSTILTRTMANPNSNNIMYFGLSGDQSATIKPTISGNTGPYSVTYTMERDLVCNNNGGSESWFTSGAQTTSGTTCTSIKSIGTISTTSPYELTVKLMANAKITATITDRYGCIVSESIDVSAEDIRCFAGKSGIAKVKMCHKTGSPKNQCTEICVDESAVATHLAHGDFIGICTTNCEAPIGKRPAVIGKEEIIEIPEFNVIAYPNPSNYQYTLAVTGGDDEPVEVVVYDMLARVVKRIAKPNAKDIQFGEELPRGEYLLLVRQGENQKAINVIKK